MANPYTALPADRFWRKAMTNVPPFAVDPRPRAPFRIGHGDRIATAGSCFAQRVAQALRDAGYNYYVIDRPPALGEAEARARGFGVFSARYGNLYYARQFVQLFDRAHGRFTPALKAWRREDGRYVDPFRPTVEPAGFADEAEVEAARASHLAEVRDLFRTLDVFVLTLGLTEGFRHRADGAALPLAPGVAGGAYDPDAYAYVNADAAEVTADLEAFLARLRTVNPEARVILTVSPVPMIATYEDRHVMVSNSYTKSVLRVAAGEAAARDGRAFYFPAYDLVTNNVTAGRYYAEDQRSINDAGVRHVMRVFLETFTGNPAGDRPAAVHGTIAAEIAANSGIVCDEEEIERSVA